MTFVQPAPFAIQIEPTEGCNLRCGFCGIRGIREKGPMGDLSGGYKFMSLDTARQIARDLTRLDWNSRLELAMHGEPTRHPQLVDIVGILRQYRPKQSIMLTTNAVPWIEDGRDPVDEIIRIVSAGLNTVALDDYRPHKVAPLVRAGRDRLAAHGITVHEYPEEKSPAPNDRDGNARRVILIADIADTGTGTHAHLANHAGAAAPKDPTWNDKVCAKPFRELSIRWDGNAAVCCDDWRGDLPIGNVNDIGLDGIWHHPRMTAVRRLQLDGGRGQVVGGPCEGCTTISYRIGLLPGTRDPKAAKRALGKPTDDDRLAIRAALAERPLTAPVLREWEPGYTPVTIGRKP